MSQRTANLIIFWISVVTTLLMLAIFIFTLVTFEVENRKDILIGTGIGVVSGLSLSLYIWSNRNNLHH